MFQDANIHPKNTQVKKICKKMHEYLQNDRYGLYLYDSNQYKDVMELIKKWWAWWLTLLISFSAIALSSMPGDNININIESVDSIVHDTVRTTDTIYIEKYTRDTIIIHYPVSSPDGKKPDVKTYILRRQVQKIILNPHYYERNG